MGKTTFQSQNLISLLKRKLVKHSRCHESMVQSHWLLFHGSLRFHDLFGRQYRTWLHPQRLLDQLLKEGLPLLAPAIRRPPYQRVRWRGEERLGEKWLSFFPSADEVCLNSRGLKDLIFPWNYFSLVIRHHLVFQIVISSYQFYLRKMYGMYGIVFSSIFWRLWLYLFSEKCPDA